MNKLEEMIVEERKLKKAKEELEQKQYVKSHLDLIYRKENRMVFITFKSDNVIKNIVETEVDGFYLRRRKPVEFELENHGFLRTLLKMERLGYSREVKQ
jgi:hypothetical protein